MCRSCCCLCFCCDCLQKRDYTVEQFRQVVDACLQAHPRMSIMTDIICGFPGETEEDHLETLRLLTDYRFPVGPQAACTGSSCCCGRRNVEEVRCPGMDLRRIGLKA